MRRTAAAVVAALLFAACQAATPAATPTAAPSTPAAATSTPSPAATATPSPSPPPSATPGQTPLPTPHPVTDIAELIDYWWVFDPVGLGPDTIHFGEDGQYVVGHGPTMGQLMGEGGYSLTDSVLTFDTGWFDCDENAVGHYRLTITYDSKSLIFGHVDDQCTKRASHLATLGQWQRGRPPRP
jgi:hypothetical protein